MAGIYVHLVYVVKQSHSCPMYCHLISHSQLWCLYTYLFVNAAPLPSACVGDLAAINCDANGQSCDYEASFAVQEDDSITITISATTAANTWVGIGVSDDQLMVSVAVFLGVAIFSGNINNSTFTQYENTALPNSLTLM